LRSQDPFGARGPSLSLRSSKEEGRIEEPKEEEEEEVMVVVEREKGQATMHDGTAHGKKMRAPPPLSTT
jgi:hypothetical protein